MRKLTRTIAAAVAVLFAHQLPASAQSEFREIVDHIHLAAPDQPKAVEWYQKHFGGQPTPEGPDRLLFDQTRVIVQKNEAAKPSAGSVVDHIGFSVADLDQTLAQFGAEGIKITTPARDVPNLFKIAFIEDPWGTRIEVVQDSQKRGLHHIHLRAADPAAALAWYSQRFGGKPGKLKGQIDGVEYGGVWVLAQKGDTQPSPGHAIDHIGFRPLDIDKAIADFKTKDIKVVTEPRNLTLPSGTSMRIAFIDGPDGVRIELVQR